jgi:hypothetical protein
MHTVPMNYNHRLKRASQFKVYSTMIKLVVWSI